MTPGQYKTEGSGMRIHFGEFASPFGRCFIAVTERGICQLAFFQEESEYQQYNEQLRRRWWQSELLEDHIIIANIAKQVFPEINARSVKEAALATDNPPPRLKLLLQGSAFQLKVWEALLAIPEGQLCSYQQVAEFIEKPQAVRAVASAIAKNDVGYLIPCHRVIRGTGEVSQYRWGATRKYAIIAWEGCRSESKKTP